MVTQRQLIANRRNAIRSTGPRTEQGKARSSQNALRHGLARQFGQQAVDLRNIAKLAQLIASENKVGQRTARAVAKAELELAFTTSVQTEAWDIVSDLLERGLLGEVAEAMRKAETIARYGKRAASRRRKVLRGTFGGDQ